MFVMNVANNLPLRNWICQQEEGKWDLLTLLSTFLIYFLPFIQQQPTPPHCGA